jgi:osmotically inducible lipoprotein OsmB
MCGASLSARATIAIRPQEDERMRKLMIIGATAAALAAATLPAQAQERTMTGAAIGAGVGAVVLGPIGAVAGGAVGAAVGGPRVARPARFCWRDKYGRRHCRYRY